MNKKPISHFQSIKPQVAKRIIMVGLTVGVLFGQAVLGSKPDLTVKGIRILPNNANFEKPEDKLPNATVSQAINFQKLDFSPYLPVAGYLSQHFSSYHPAVDLASVYNSPIYPIGPGHVVATGWDPYGKGKIVVVEHTPNLKSLYAHMSKIDVKVGDSVDPKTAIGRVGLTGHTTGPHLHLEVYENNEAVNPENYLPQVSTSPASIAANL